MCTVFPVLLLVTIIFLTLQLDEKSMMASSSKSNSSERAITRIALPWPPQTCWK
ncbi:hypothetical protein PILCRDRAFT_811089 [Piloderma croceum F 1598]|uniref:Uncharacterized protein n=1 Tax=Piloderma croceum (strain F 1598) TaxID=765440 RepID=A0A0C3CLW4_PILCF|nr:hypothetical protein PILCRDRAFT_811089 [Piloderma croceum F 1598]